MNKLNKNSTGDTILIGIGIVAVVFVIIKFANAQWIFESDNTEDQIAEVVTKKIDEHKKSPPAKYINPMDTIKHFPTFKKWVDEDIESVRNINTDRVHDVGDVVSRSKIFGSYMDLIAKARFVSPEAEEYVKKLENELKRSQRKYFPELRAKYGEYARQLLWIDDIDVKVIGSRKDRIQFIGATFAANRNIKQTHEGLLPVLRTLRFKRADYKWIPSDSQYSYYEITSREDDELVSN